MQKITTEIQRLQIPGDLSVREVVLFQARQPQNAGALGFACASGLASAASMWFARERMDLLVSMCETELLGDLFMVGALLQSGKIRSVL